MSRLKHRLRRPSLMACQCCCALAKFRVGSSPSCGRHLVTIINMEAPLTGGTVRVEVITHSSQIPPK